MNKISSDFSAAVSLTCGSGNSGATGVTTVIDGDSYTTVSDKTLNCGVQTLSGCEWVLPLVLFVLVVLTFQ